MLLLKKGTAIKRYAVDINTITDAMIGLSSATFRHQESMWL